MATSPGFPHRRERAVRVSLDAEPRRVFDFGRLDGYRHRDHLAVLIAMRRFVSALRPPRLEQRQQYHQGPAQPSADGREPSDLHGKGSYRRDHRALGNRRAGRVAVGSWSKSEIALTAGTSLPRSHRRATILVRTPRWLPPADAAPDGSPAGWLD